MPANADLTARELADESGGWVVEASWPDRNPEILLGVFTSRERADHWIRNASHLWRTATK